MSTELKEGLEISRVEWPSMDPEGNNFFSIAGNISTITVTMVAGPMSMLPWASVVNNEGQQVALVNLQNCIYIELRSGK